jgi:hypothetical protein
MDGLTSDSDVERYVTIMNLLGSFFHYVFETKITRPELLWNTTDSSSLIKALHSMWDISDKKKLQCFSR